MRWPKLVQLISWNVLQTIYFLNSSQCAIYVMQTIIGLGQKCLRRGNLSNNVQSSHINVHLFTQEAKMTIFFTRTGWARAMFYFTLQGLSTINPYKWHQLTTSLTYSLLKIEPHHEKTSLCHMQTTKAQISLRIRAVRSAPLLFAG